MQEMQEMKKSHISENLPKSVKEKFYEKMRRTCGDEGKGRKSAEIARREPAIADRIRPEKPADHGNVPRFKRKNRKKLNLAKEDRALLLNVIDHMMSTMMGGWRQEGDTIVNETGRIASSEKWSLNGDRLALSSGQVDLDTDRLYEFRQLVG